MDDLTQKALKFAMEKHKGQVDDQGLPFILHPMQVARILDSVTDDINLIASALLHDTIEDTGATYEELKREFNEDIANLVYEVTKEGKKDNHGFYFPRLKTQRGIMLKFADRLSNISRMEAWDEKRRQHYLKSSKFWKSE